MNQIDINISMVESRIQTQKDCKQYWRGLLRWDYVKDCEENIKELETELREQKRQKIESQIELEWDGVFTFMQASNEKEMNKCMNNIEGLERDLAVCIKKQGV